jgi:hypothetical protein
MYQRKQAAASAGFLLEYSSTLKVEAICFSETLGSLNNLALQTHTLFTVTTVRTSNPAKRIIFYY